MYPWKWAKDGLELEPLCSNEKFSSVHWLKLSDWVRPFEFRMNSLKGSHINGLHEGHLSESLRVSSCIFLHL